MAVTTPGMRVAYDYVTPFAIPIALGPLWMPLLPMGRTPNIATCIAVASPGRQWLLTAWHVLKPIAEELRNPESVCHIGCDRSGMPLITLNRIEMDAERFSERLDIATLQIPTLFADLIDRMGCFVFCARIGGHYSHAP